MNFSIKEIITATMILFAVIDIIGSILISGKNITKESKVREIFDELDMIEFIMATEEEFKIEILDSEVEKFIIMEDIVRFIESKKNEKN